MLVTKKIRVGKKYVLGLCLPLQTKKLIVLRGEKGYVMCGYLNLQAAQKCNDAAVKITGVANIQEALRTTVHSCTAAARRLGVHKNQPIKKVLGLIA